MDAPNVLENKPEKNNIKFDVTESFEITFNKKRFVLTISYNENLIFLDIEEKDVIIKEEYNIYLSLEQLGKINKYFKQFDTLKEVFDSLKFIIQNKSMTITKEENTMKIKIINPGNGKEFFINIPLKKKDLKAEIDSIIPYVSSLNAKIQILENKVNDLEKKLNEFYIYKSEIKNLIKKEVKE